jgi:hypothetical protein
MATSPIEDPALLEAAAPAALFDATVEAMADIGLLLPAISVRWRDRVGVAPSG